MYVPIKLAIWLSNPKAGGSPRQGYIEIRCEVARLGTFLRYVRFWAAPLPGGSPTQWQIQCLHTYLKMKYLTKCIKYLCDKFVSSVRGSVSRTD